MKKVLLFGAGKSATVLIDYLLENAGRERWKVTVADADLNLALSKTGNSPFAEAISFDIHDAAERNTHIKKADIVISLLPPSLHIKVARDCIKHGKHLLTASYIDEEIRRLQPEIEQSKALFLYEMGLDPGIDHMSAMQIIDGIHAKGGKIVSFKSHCGGLVAPESDDNPWRYKISWNPRNIVLAGKAGAHFRENGKEVRVQYEELFNTERIVDIPGLGLLCWYPNRDSLNYTSLYGLENTPTFIRTTLRHADFIFGWKNIIELKLTDETVQYNTEGKSLCDAFKEHMTQHGFDKWLEEKLEKRFASTRSMMENLMKLVNAETEAEREGLEMPDSFMAADEDGNIEEVAINDVKDKAAAYLAHNMHQANLTLKQLFFLGLDDRDTILDKAKSSAADILQFALEKKLALRPYDKDMIVMLHEIEYELDGKKTAVSSSLIVKGENNIRTAMAKTVGLPLGIAVKSILNGTIQLTGLHLPVSKEIYEPVLKELKQHEVFFNEITKEF